MVELFWTLCLRGADLVIVVFLLAPVLVLLGFCGIYFLTDALGHFWGGRSVE